MSSILEALKKLEAEKHADAPAVISRSVEMNFGGDALLRDLSDSSATSRNAAPILWVLGGGIFTVLIIGVVVLVVMLLLQRDRADSALIAAATPPVAPPSPTATPTLETAVPVDTTQPPNIAEATETSDENTAKPPEAMPAAENKVAVPLPVIDPVRPAPEPEATRSKASGAPDEPMVSTPVTPRAILTTEPKISDVPQTSSAPLPSDIRNLPMLTRSERTQYRLEVVELNMLNPTGPTRPLGNAFINLEKVFIGEFLPGSNAKLLDVTSHGIAVEIQSTQQRYYIPR